MASADDLPALPPDVATAYAVLMQIVQRLAHEGATDKEIVYALMAQISGGFVQSVLAGAGPAEPLVAANVSPADAHDMGIA